MVASVKAKERRNTTCSGLDLVAAELAYSKLHFLRV